MALSVEIDGRSIVFERPEKWVWFDSKLTMLDLASYYTAVSPWLLPYLEHRPVVYETYKGTINGPNSFEQDPPAATPRWVRRAQIQGHERMVTYVLADSAATLVYLVSLFMVTLHVWESRLPAIEKPDFLLFDLDPAESCPLSRLAKTALRLKELLAEHGIERPLIKTSGARGLHVWVPQRPRETFATVRASTERIARELAARYPKEISAERNPRKRAPVSVYIDWGQMGRGMTIAPPFVPRACEGAPVSMPIVWDEVVDYARSRSRKPPSETFARYHVRNVPEFLRSNGDAWAGAGDPGL
ncbi:MAG TPA: hypothetical protein VFL13_03475, partial [Candidatus Baltobacteraceae bacterium]|nr:hypothetical protein [Candidatus Baltobacteraceae bacterium]